MDIPAFRIVQPDLRLVGKIDLALSSSFNFSTSTAHDEGYWVRKVSNAAALVDATPTLDVVTNSWLTYPVIASSKRLDVRQSLAITVAFGSMLIETTRYKAGITFAEGNLITVRADSLGRGILDVAAATERIFGFVWAAPVANTNGLMVQLNWTGQVAS